jgi:hypothetical protein
VKERPIIFTADSVNAILRGDKTQTRRLIKPMRGQEWLTLEDIRSVPHGEIVNGGWQMRHPLADTDYAGVHVAHDSPLGWIRLPHSIGDRLWVKEAFALSIHDPDTSEPDIKNEDDWDAPVYRADGENQGGGWTRDGKPVPPPWRSPLFMPRWASRLTLQIVDIRVQRIQDISEEDAKAEGVKPRPYDPEGDCWTDGKYRTAFNWAWNEMHGWDPNAWERNDWVFAISFRPVDVRQDCGQAARSHSEDDR